MSGEGEDLLYQSPGVNGLLFPDISGVNGDDLDFTKDFFSDDLSNTNELNVSNKLAVRRMF
jgi:hypothetical protein